MGDGDSGRERGKGERGVDANERHRVVGFANPQQTRHVIIVRSRLLQAYVYKDGAAILPSNQKCDNSDIHPQPRMQRHPIGRGAQSTVRSAVNGGVQTWVRPASSRGSDSLSRESRFLTHSSSLCRLVVVCMCVRVCACACVYARVCVYMQA